MNRSPSPLRVIIVEDSEEVVVLLRRHLESCGFELSWLHVQDAAALSAALDEHPWDVVISDHEMPNFSSLGTLKVVSDHGLDTPVIIVSGRVGDSFAASLMTAGARDFVPKTNLARLFPVINREMEDGTLRRRSRKFETDKDEAIRELTGTLDSLRKTQEHLVRTERYQALAQMGSGVAHDFNNSLTKMIGIIELMIEHSPDPSQPLQQLRTTVLEAAKIVQRLRAFYHPIQSCVDADPTDLNAVVEAAVDMTKPKWKTQSQVDGHPIEVNLDLGQLPPVMAKFEELREAIVNLLLNSCDALPEGGAITVTTEVIEDSVVTTIRDTGVGMADIVRKRCLEPYFTTKGKSHLGLGLGLVNRLLRSLSGTMKMQSEEGVGTAVILGLPAQIPAENESPLGGEGGNTATAIDSLHILVVDDLAVRVLIAQFLRLDGHEVDLAKNGMDALEKFDPARHQLVISDRAMPVLNGDQLALGIKERAATTPVIMASGYVDAFTTDRDRPSGVDLLLAKPITRESLRTALCSTMKSPPRVLQNSS